MMKIKMGDTVLTVTHGAYKNYYKHLGYKPVGVSQTAENSAGENTHPTDDSQHCEDSTQPKTDENPEEEPDDAESFEDEEPELSEIPLSEMTGPQLRQYAEQLGLSHEGLKKRELRELIRNHLK